MATPRPVPSGTLAQSGTSVPLGTSSTPVTHSFEDAEVMFFHNMIVLCQKRGAFVPEEMVHVGTMYNKLKDLVPEIEKRAQAAKKPENRVVELN